MANSDKNTDLGNSADALTGLSDAVDELSGKITAAAAAETAAVEPARKYSAEQDAIKQALESLNGLIPGLGTTLGLLSQGYFEEANAAKAGVVANESFIISMGPIALVTLTIQAVAACWDSYKEKADAAAEAQKTALEKTIESLHKALAAQNEFNKAVNGGEESPTKKYSDKESKDVDVLRARVQGNKELLQIKEQQEMTAAKTPEARAEIKNRYAHLNQFQTDFQEAGEISIKQSEVGAIDDDIRGHTVLGEQIKSQLAGVGVNGDPASRDQLTKELAQQTDIIGKLKERSTQLQTETDAATATQSVHQDTEAKAAAQRLQGDDTVAAGVSAIIANEQVHKLTQSQQQAYNDLTSAYQVIAGNQDKLLDAIRYAHAHSLTKEEEINQIKQQLQWLANNRPTS